MVNVQKQIRKIMTTLDRKEQEIALRKLAMELGCSLSSTYTSNGKHLDDEVIRRIQEAARSIRESRLWLVALISAIASFFSALAAWFAVLRN